MIIVIEGPDGSGKSTVSKLVAEKLGAWHLAFPDRTTPIGKIIGSWLKGELEVISNDDPSEENEKRTSALVFQGLQSANRLEHLELLTEAAAGKLALVLDRYWQSGVVYGELDGLDPAYIREVSMQLPQAAYTFILEAPAEVLAERLKSTEAYDEHVERVCDGYRRLWEGINDSSYIRVDATAPIGDIVNDIIWRIGR